jgi:hypothetical protein
MMSEYVPLATLIEDPLQKFKDELGSLGKFDEINEGEKIYQGAEPWVQVIPGMDRITLEGNQQLHHRFNIFVNFLQASSETTLPELRKLAEIGFNKLIEDQTHDGTCWKCLPTLWNPGFMGQGEVIFVGVQTAWVAENWQTFSPPLYRGKRFTDMEELVESIVAVFKEELFEVEGIDEINEGEKPYQGEGTVAWVIPAESRISSVQRARLEHEMTLYQNLISSSPTMTFSEMRRIGEAAYDRLMVDITHERTCSSCIPTLWHPGFIQFGSQSYVGIQGRWLARIHQDYTPT